MRNLTSSHRPAHGLTIALAAAALVLACGTLTTSAAQDAGGGEQAPQSEIERFCGNIADAARDRRYALQTKQLEDLRAEVDQRIAALEAKRAEYEDWLQRREKFMQKARESVVDIYSRMRPDAAAAQLSVLRADLAAALLIKLDARKAGVILNEMDPKAAAALTSIMADAARPKDPS